MLPCLVLLCLPLGLAAQSAPADRPQRMERARAHVEAQEYDAALHIYRELAAENPRDFEARIWVARLESWQGNYREAEEGYRQVLRDAPGTFEAELGLVDVLSWQGRYGEAEERLLGLEAQHPQNAEVLLRRGRLHRWRGRRKEAVHSYEQVLALDPGNQEAQEALAALRSETRYQLAAGYFFEEFDFAGETNGQFVELLYHDLDRVWLLGRFQFQNKFDENNTRYTLGGTYRFFRRTWVRAEASLSAPNDRVIANQDYTLEITQGLHPRLAAGGSYRFLNFRDADVQVLTALVNWTLRRDLRLFVRYSPARTMFDATGQSVWNQNGSVRLEWDAHRKVSPYVLFAVGSESFAGLTAEQLGRFAAQTWGVGAEVRVTNVQGFRAGYYFQNRTRNNREQGFALSYYRRF